MKFQRTSDGRLDYAVDFDQNGLIIALARDTKPGENFILFCQTVTIAGPHGINAKVVCIDDVIIGVNFLFPTHFNVEKAISAMSCADIDEMVRRLFDVVLKDKSISNLPTNKEMFQRN